MDGGQLYRLGKRLVELARDVTTGAGASSLTQGEIAMLEDVLRHPDSPISTIAARTGFAQSHVSASVARLSERELVETGPDPADRRRTLVRLAPLAARAIRSRAGAAADDEIARALADPARATRAIHLLDELADLLLPPA